MTDIFPAPRMVTFTCTSCGDRWRVYERSRADVTKTCGNCTINPPLYREGA